MGPPHIRGLRWLPSRIDNAIECAFAADADADTVVALLQTIPRRGGLRFFDYLYHGEPPPQVAVDPGAIFCVYRRLRGDLFATCGNHGWSSPWTPVSHQRLGAFVLDCIDSNRGDGARTRSMLLEARATYVPGRAAIDPHATLFVRRDAFAQWRRA